MKKNIFIIFLSLLVIGLAGFVGYDKFLKPTSKCICKTTKKESKEKTADERYKEYVNNLAKSIEENYSESGDGKALKINEDYYTSGITNETYRIYVTGKKELYLNYINSEDPSKKLADNVVKYYNVYVGNGGYRMIYYITTEGKLYSIDVESIGTELKEPKELDKKNIVEVREGLSTDENGIGARTPIFIDIDGNLYIE